MPGIGKGSRWGINLGGVDCPRCGAHLSFARLPKSLHQAAWGGYTCGECGAEIDKWGEEIDES